MTSLDTFFTAFFPDESEEIHLRFFPPKGGRGAAIKRTVTRLSLREDEALQAELKLLNKTSGAYFVVNAGGDEDRTITRYNAWFVESDEASIEEQHHKLDACPVQPSIRVETRKSVHAYWLIEGECSETKWRDMQARLIAYFDGDPKNKNPSRVMRVPYFKHIALGSAGEFQYKQVALAYFVPVRISVEQMRAAFPEVYQEPIEQRYATGQYPTWDLLNAEARRRILAHQDCQVRGEWAHIKGSCHDGKGDTGLALNIASGAFFCQKGCSTAHVLASLGLPEKPDTYKPSRESSPTERAAVLKEASQQEPVDDEPVEGIYTVRSLSHRIARLYETGLTPGVDPGWDNVRRLYSVKKGFFTVITGTPSSGKSQFLDNLLINLSSLHGWKFVVCSLENLPLEQHSATLLELYTGEPFTAGPHPRMSVETRMRGEQWLDERFTFILPKETDCTITGLLRLIDYHRERHHIDGIVIDPWNEFEHRRPAMMTETEYISEILSKIRRYARAFDLHIWLVAHPRKLEKKSNGAEPVPTLYDIAGSAHFRAKADFGISLWRDMTDENSPTEVHIQKVRFRWCGKIGMAELYFDPVTGRYSEVRHTFALPGRMPYRDDDEMEEL